LTAILREACTTSQQTEDRREKIQELSLAKECYSMKLDLLTNAAVVDDAIKFLPVSQQQKESKEVIYEQKMNIRERLNVENDVITTNEVFNQFEDYKILRMFEIDSIK
jgi:hypothetical protein